jgi:hypothetical protein
MREIRHGLDLPDDIFTLAYPPRAPRKVPTELMVHPLRMGGLSNRCELVSGLDAAENPKAVR